MPRKKTIEDFWEQTNKNQTNKFDYSRLLFNKATDRIEVRCIKHDLWLTQVALYHMQGRNPCLKCASERLRDERSFSTETFLNKAKKQHGDKYNYSKTVYYNMMTKVVINCPIHGDFNQTPLNHLSGKGCKDCGKIRIQEKLSKTTEQFILDSKEKHGNKYDYEKSNYVNATTKVFVKCPNHGYFLVTPNNHNTGKGCPVCSESQGEKEIRVFLEQNNIVFETQKCFEECRDKKPLPFDFWLSELNCLIEFDGKQHFEAIDHFGGQESLQQTQFHDTIKNKFASEKAITLIRIRYDQITLIENVLTEFLQRLEFERKFGTTHNFVSIFKEATYKKGVLNIVSDQWRDKQQIIESRLNYRNKKTKSIFARKCEVREVNSKDSSKFQTSNHIQGSVGSKVRLGLYYNDNIISLMTFGYQRVNLGRKSEDGCWELLRFCSKLNHNVPGAASKLLKYFEKKYEPKKLISYADKNWSPEGNVYRKLGFKHIRDSSPCYSYFKNGKRYNRYQFRKSQLIKKGADSAMTERQIMHNWGYVRVWDLGCLVFEKDYE